MIRFSISNVPSPEEDFVSFEGFDEERIGEDGSERRRHDVSFSLLRYRHNRSIDPLLENLIALMNSTEQPNEQDPRVLLGQLQSVLVFPDKELGE